MTKPELLGVEVLTPDGRGEILAFYQEKVKVGLNRIAFRQEMKGMKSGGEMHYTYKYEDVTVIKGQYCFNEQRLKFQYEKEYVYHCKEK